MSWFKAMPYEPPIIFDYTIYEYYLYYKTKNNYKLRGNANVMQYSKYTTLLL